MQLNNYIPINISYMSLIQEFVSILTINLIWSEKNVQHSLFSVRPDNQLGRINHKKMDS